MSQSHAGCSSSSSLLRSLFDQNQTWSSQQPRSLLDQLCSGQSPKILWIGCSDSRVPETTITQSNPGDLFVTRNIANQFNPNDDNVVSVLTYAVHAVGVEHVVIVGHSGCGGVAAAIQHARLKTTDLESMALLRYLRPLIQLASEVIEQNPSLDETQLMDKVTFESVKQQVENVVQSSIIQHNWSKEPSPLSGSVMKTVSVHGWKYDLGSGQLIDLGLTRTPE